MKKLNIYFVIGNMLTGKTSLIEQIKKQNGNFENFYFLLEKNLYSDLKNQEKRDFHFFIQVFLMNNFLLNFKRVLKKANDTKKEEVFLFSDTFPFITGLIFTKAKYEHFLIKESEYNFLIDFYEQNLEKFQKVLFDIKDLEIGLNINVIFRQIGFEFSKEVLKNRSEKEYDFYILQNESYYENLFNGLKNLDFYEKMFYTIFDKNELKFIQQKEINTFEGFENNNKEIFNMLYL